MSGGTCSGRVRRPDICLLTLPGVLKTGRKLIHVINIIIVLRWPPSVHTRMAAAVQDGVDHADATFSYFGDVKDVNGFVVS